MRAFGRSGSSPCPYQEVLSHRLLNLALRSETDSRNRYEPFPAWAAKAIDSSSARERRRRAGLTPCSPHLYHSYLCENIRMHLEHIHTDRRKNWSVPFPSPRATLFFFRILDYSGSCFLFEPDIFLSLSVRCFGGRYKSVKHRRLPVPYEKWAFFPFVYSRKHESSRVTSVTVLLLRNRPKIGKVRYRTKIEINVFES